MKNILLKTLDKIKEDAQFLVYFTNSSSSTFSHSFKEKSFIEHLIKNENPCNICLNPIYTDFIKLDDNISISIKSFIENIYYETKIDLNENFKEYISKYNKYYNIFIKLDKENKTITFKLGDKIKTLILIEEGFDGYVSKQYKQKYLKCVDIEDLEKHINDQFMNPRMIKIGRKILKIDNYLLFNQ